MMKLLVKAEEVSMSVNIERIHQQVAITEPVIQEMFDALLKVNDCSSVLVSTMFSEGVAKQAIRHLNYGELDVLIELMEGFIRDVRALSPSNTR